MSDQGAAKNDTSVDDDVGPSAAGTDASVGIGVIGCGGMGSWHAANAAAQPGCTVVAVADAVSAAATNLADRLGARVQDGLDLIAADDVDAVIVASSDESHAVFTVAAIAAGKPCLVEKPLAANLADARSILDAEVEAGRRLVRVGFMREFDPAHREMAAAVERLGAITRVRCVHRNVDATPRPVKALFAQSLIHDIHTVRWLTGDEFRRVSVNVVERDDGFRDVLMVGELAGGGLAVIDFEDQAFAYEVQVEVTAMRGMAATLPHPRAVVRQGAAESLSVGTDWFGRFEDAYRIEVEGWLRAVIDGQPSGPTIWDGYAAQVVADRAEQAMLTGSAQAVELLERPSLYR